MAMTHLNILAPRAWTGSRGLSTAAMASLAVLLAVAGGIVAACLALGGCSGYWYGWSSGRHSVEAMENQIGTAFAAGPDAAGVWLQLMRNNDPRQALNHCSGAAVWSDNGRQACSVPLWINGPGAPQVEKK